MGKISAAKKKQNKSAEKNLAWLAENQI